MGKVLRSIGYTEEIPAAGDWELKDDGSFYMKTIYTWHGRGGDVLVRDPGSAHARLDHQVKGRQGRDDGDIHHGAATEVVIRRFSIGRRARPNC